MRPKSLRNSPCPACGTGVKFKRCCMVAPFDPDAPQIAARAAGRKHERPALFGYTQRKPPCSGSSSGA